VDANDTGDGLLTLFLSEAEEIVDSLFGHLRELRHGYDSQGVLSAAHRGLHTLAGGSRVLALGPMAELAAAGGELFLWLRDSEMALDSRLIKLIDALLTALADMVEALKQGQPLPALDPDLYQRLQKVLQQRPTLSSVRQVDNPPVAEPVVTKQRMEGFGKINASPLPVELLRGAVAVQALPDLRLNTEQGEPFRSLAEPAMAASRLEQLSRELTALQQCLSAGDDGQGRRSALQSLAELAVELGRLSATIAAGSRLSGAGRQ
jgi:chemotaxis protein histidine kinase CheA